MFVLVYEDFNKSLKFKFLKPVRLSKAECIRFCASLPKGAPDCPYFCLPCRNFYVNLASAVCCEGDFRCSWLPSWVSDGYHLAVLRGGRLHV